jgi:hypothetical protein
MFRLFAPMQVQTLMSVTSPAQMQKLVMTAETLLDRAGTGDSTALACIDLMACIANVRCPAVGWLGHKVVAVVLMG